MLQLLLLLLMGGLPLTDGPELVEVRGKADITRNFSPTARLHVVNFWATWCVPCVAEMPDLQAVDDSFRDRDVEFVGVSLDSAIPGAVAERKALVRRFLTRRNIRFKILYYIGKPAKIADDYEFDGEIPLTIVYDHAGNELMRHKGVIDAGELTRKLSSFLAK